MMEKLIEAISVSKPPMVLVAVDGPKPDSATDKENVKRVQHCVERINWNSKVETRFRTSNMGLKASISDAVSWATSEYGSVVVIEDDLVPGPQMIPYANFMIEKYRSESAIAHINLYNIVPSSSLRNVDIHSRLTRFPESYCWATWGNSWANYDDSLEWGLNCSIQDLSKVTGSKIGALKWKMNFHDAASGRIQTWAYRWIASIWSKGQYAITPNANLSSYIGSENGTHTFRQQKFDELPVEFLNFEEYEADDLEMNLDLTAEDYMAREVFGENLKGLLDGVVSTAIMELIRKKRSMGSAARNFR
jgi:hypothetical protein